MKNSFTLTCFLLSLMASAQFTISGTILDESGEPLLGVNVYVEGTYDGATSDLEGHFSFETAQTDDLVLIVSSIGFIKETIALTGSTDTIEVKLREEISQLNSVIITAGSFNASEENQREVLRPLDIATTAGATADIPGALNTLPGTQRVGETGRLFVRGGEGRETKTFIDGMLVHEEYSPTAPNTPSRSRFSPFMFKGASFSTGGYSAEFGQALSSALVLESKEAAESNRTDLSFMTVGADVSTTQTLPNGSVAAKVQYTNLTPYFEFIPQNLQWDTAPTSWDGNIAVRQKTGKTGLLKLYANLSTSSLAIREASISEPEILLPATVSNDYTYLNASYRTLLSDKWGIRTGTSFTTSSDFASLDKASRKQDLLGFHSKLVGDYQHSDRFALVVGGELMGRSIKQRLQEQETYHRKVDEYTGASFAELEFYFSKDIALKTGLRGEYNALNEEMSVDPRIAAAYKTGTHSQVSIAYGRFRQSASDEVIINAPSAEQEKATHYIANYQHVADGQTFRIEAYEKRYSDLAQFQDINNTASYQYRGDGHARGIELFWRDRKSIKNLDYWVSYSFLDTERTYRNYPGAYTPPFASSHNFSVVTKKFIDQLKSQVGVTYSFASARTYNDRNSERFLSGRTPAYHDLSFNISYLYSNQIIIHAMVNNALGINNVFGYEYASEPDTNGVFARRAITPPAKRFIFLGIFITLSKNKGINQLPNL
ncbi:MAG: TonB-dependent receptor [Bacteroidota bacterium]